MASKSPQQVQPRERLFNFRNLYGLLAIRGKRYRSTTLRRVDVIFMSTSKSPAQAAVDSLDQICDQNIVMPLNEPVWNSYRLWVAGVVARLPILAIMHANIALPKIGRDPHPDQTAPITHTYTTLEVKWLRVGLIAASIAIGQLLAILTVLYYCNGVYTRDDSALATAELLTTVINRFDGGKLMTGEELAVSLDSVLGAPVSYGTREGQVGGPPEVDLASGLDAMFPRFPPEQRS